MTSDAGALLLRHADRSIELIDRVAACFVDHRSPDFVVHGLPALAGQRIVGIALGCEDVGDHDDLRHDPVLALLAGRIEPKHRACAVLAGKSTLNRPEHAPAGSPGRYHRISHDPTKLETLLVDLSIEAHAQPPKRIIIGLDATDDPLHGHQEGRLSIPPRALRFTAIAAATATCRSPSSAATGYLPPGCGHRPSTPRPAPEKRSSGSWRHGKQDQGNAARSVRRSHLDRLHEGQSAPAPVRRVCPCPDRSAPSAGLRHTQFATATAGTIRNRLLKIGALVTVSVRRCLVRMAQTCPYQSEFALACLRLGHRAA